MKLISRKQRVSPQILRVVFFAPIPASSTLVEHSGSIRARPPSPQPPTTPSMHHRDPRARTPKCAFRIHALITSPHFRPWLAEPPQRALGAAVIWAVPQQGWGTHGRVQGTRVTHCSAHPRSAGAGPAVCGSSPVPAALPRSPDRAPLPRRPPRTRRQGSRCPGGWARAAAAATLAGTRPARLAHPASGAGCRRLSEARGLPARLPQRLGAGPLPAQVLQQPRSAPQQPGGSGSSFSRTAPLHTSLMAPLGAVWENDFSPLPETDFLHFISPHRPSGSKMLTFSGGRQTQLTLIYPSNGERLYYKPLAAVPRLGPSSSPLVPQTLT